MPAHVDPRNGYRWYTADQVTTARLLQVLRDAGVSLSDIKRIAAGECGDEQALQILDSHLERLESGLAEARRAVARARALLTGPELARAAMATGLAVANGGSNGSPGNGSEPCACPRARWQ